MKKFLTVMLSVLLLLGAVACGQQPKEAEPGDTNAAETSDTETGEEPAAATEKKSDAKSPDNDLVVALQADATNLDPHVSGNGVSNMVTDTMYESLLTFDENTNIVPMLAKEWSVSDDGLAYTFKLNEGIKFSDGEPFNAEAVVKNYERGKNDPSLRLAHSVENWESVEVVNDYELIIHLKEANNTFINKLTQVKMVSPKAIEELGKDGLNHQSAGTGPFILDERIDGGSTKVVRNENYWRDGPGIDSLTFKVVPEDGARIAMLKTGEADVIYPVPPIQVDKIQNNPDIIVLNEPGLTYRYVTLNKNYTLADGRKPFDDVRVRQAMNWAFDSDAYCNIVFHGYARVPQSIFSSNIMYFTEQQPYTKDLDKAKKLMAEAGYEDGFPVTIWVDNTTLEMQGAEFVKQQLSEINIDVNVMPMESTTIADMTSAPEDENEVQMWYVNWSSGSYEADGSMRNILHRDKYPPAGYNTSFWDNQEFSDLLDEALVKTDPDEIQELYSKAQKIAWEECPWIFLGNDNEIVGIRSWVNDMIYKPGGSMIFTNVSLNH